MLRRQNQQENLCSRRIHSLLQSLSEMASIKQKEVLMLSQVLELEHTLLSAQILQATDRAPLSEVSAPNRRLVAKVP